MYQHSKMKSLCYATYTTPLKCSEIVTCLFVAHMINVQYLHAKRLLTQVEVVGQRLCQILILQVLHPPPKYL